MKATFVPFLRWSVTILLVAAAIIAAIAIWRRYEEEPWTRDGHVRADVVRVTTDVGGLITRVMVRDNQAVRRGDLLLVVDRPRYVAALEQTEADIASSRATLEQAKKEARRDLGKARIGLV